jgi:hypothetical protein
MTSKKVSLHFHAGLDPVSGTGCLEWIPAAAYLISDLMQGREDERWWLSTFKALLKTDPND